MLATLSRPIGLWPLSRGLCREELLLIAASAPMAKGYYYPHPQTATFTTSFNFTANTVYILPFFKPNAALANRLFFRITGTWSGNVRVGVAEHSGATPYDITLTTLYDSGDIAVAASGTPVVYTPTIPQNTLPNGHSFLLLTCDTTSPSSSVMAYGNMNTWRQQYGTQVIAGIASVGFTVAASSYGAFATSYTSTDLIDQTGGNTLPVVAAGWV